MKRIWGLVAAAALMSAACGDDAPAASDPTTTTAVASTTPGSADTTTTTTTTATAMTTAATPRSAVGGSVAVRLRGPIVEVGDDLRVCTSATPLGCHGGVVLADVEWADVDSAPRQESWGSWTESALVVDGDLDEAGLLWNAAVSADDRAPEISTECDIEAGSYPTVGGPTFEDVRGTINDYIGSIGEQLGGPTSYDSFTGSHTIRVVGPVEVHQAAIDALLPGRVCVVSVGFSQWDIDAAANTARALFDTWIDRGYGSPSVGAGGAYNRANVGLSAMDSRFWDDFGADAQFVRLDAFAEVLTGTVDELPDPFPVPPSADTARLSTSCFGRPFDPLFLEGEPDNHFDGHESNAAFSTDNAFGPPLDGSIGWWRVYESPADVVLLNEDMEAVSLADFGSGWIVAGRGSCGFPRFDPLGLTLAPWRQIGEAGAAATAVEIEFSEPACTGGQPPGDRLLDPVVDETDDEVVITVFLVPPSGPQTCPGNPAVIRTVALDSPLADRELVDGSIGDVS